MISLGYMQIPTEDSINLGQSSSTQSKSFVIDSIRVQNGIFGNLTGRTLDDVNYFDQTAIPAPMDVEFDDKTIIKATFDGHLSAGSFRFENQNVIAINVKRRIKNSDGEYQLIYTYKLRKDGDKELISFSFSDNTLRANTEYEYAIFPIVKSDDLVYEQPYMNIDGEDAFISIAFDGFVLSDLDYTYNIFVEADVTVNRGKRSSIVEPIGNRKKPFVVYPGELNYSTGTVNGMFVLRDGCELVYKDIYKARDSYIDFLYNGKPKLLRLSDGQMFLINVTSQQITQDHSDHQDKIVISFDFTEIDECDNLETLHRNGIIDAIYDVEKLIYDSDGAADV